MNTKVVNRVIILGVDDGLAVQRIGTCPIYKQRTIVGLARTVVRSRGISNCRQCLYTEKATEADCEQLEHLKRYWMMWGDDRGIRVPNSSDLKNRWSVGLADGDSRNRMVAVEAFEATGERRTLPPG